MWDGGAGVDTLSLGGSLWRPSNPRAVTSGLTASTPRTSVSLLSSTHFLEIPWLLFLRAGEQNTRTLFSVLGLMERFCSWVFRGAPRCHVKSWPHLTWESPPVIHQRLVSDSFQVVLLVNCPLFLIGLGPTPCSPPVLWMLSHQLHFLSAGPLSSAGL